MDKTIRKFIYILLYILIICCFIYIGTRNYNNSEYKNDAEKFNAEYKNVPIDNNFKYLNSTELINLLENGTGLVFMGDKDNAWSVAYAKILYETSKQYGIDKIYYYDARKVKELKNSNYYAIIKELDGFLTTTDTSDDNLFTPSLYALINGKIVYNDTTSSVVKNKETPENFWTFEKKSTFKDNIYNAYQLIIDNK